jgi:hypothetical protein
MTHVFFPELTHCFLKAPPVMRFFIPTPKSELLALEIGGYGTIAETVSAQLVNGTFIIFGRSSRMNPVVQKAMINRAKEMQQIADKIISRTSTGGQYVKSLREIPGYKNGRMEAKNRNIP